MESFGLENTTKINSVCFDKSLLLVVLCIVSTNINSFEVNWADVYLQL